MKAKIDSSEFPSAIVPPEMAPILTLRVLADDVLRSSTIVPAASSLAPFVHVRPPSPVLKAPPAPIAWPFHSLSLNRITVPAAIGSMTMKAKPSLPSALKPTNAIEPGPRAIEILHYEKGKECRGDTRCSRSTEGGTPQVRSAAGI